MLWEGFIQQKENILEIGKDLRIEPRFIILQDNKHKHMAKGKGCLSKHISVKMVQA